MVRLHRPHSAHSPVVGSSPWLSSSPRYQPVFRPSRRMGPWTAGCMIPCSRNSALLPLCIGGYHRTQTGQAARGIKLTILAEVSFPVLGLHSVETHVYYVFYQLALEFSEMHALQFCKTDSEMTIISEDATKGIAFWLRDGKNEIRKVFLDHPWTRIAEIEPCYYIRLSARPLGFFQTRMDSHCTYHARQHISPVHCPWCSSGREE